MGNDGSSSGGRGVSPNDHWHSCAAAKDGKTCAHKCCVDAAKDGKNCAKCGGSGDIAKPAKK